MKIRPDNFSYEGLTALYDYLTELEEDLGEEMELDVIAICCEFTEYENLEEFCNNYSGFNTMEEIEQNTTVIPIPDTDRFIIEDF